METAGHGKLQFRLLFFAKKKQFNCQKHFSMMNKKYFYREKRRRRRNKNIVKVIFVCGYFFLSKGIAKIETLLCTLYFFQQHHLLVIDFIARDILSIITYKYLSTHSICRVNFFDTSYLSSYIYEE